MPTLTRLIIIVAVIAAIIYAVMLALVSWVKPVTTEVIIRIPAHKILEQPADNPPPT
ncbi:histidine kinase [Pseudochrobactrum sp. MP213Fo]|uniref:histidine kinase n=1 Tax=Pseudochrobactrum sp. MP213Fo TaxID=3022250 RepID=UPI003B9F4AEC